MYKRILVPLDGSVIAEAALPYAIRLAMQTEAQLILFRVASSQPNTPAITAHNGENRQSPENYHEDVRHMIISPGIYPHAHPEQVETTIVHSASLRKDYIADRIIAPRVDLVVMSKTLLFPFSKLYLLR